TLFTTDSFPAWTLSWASLSRFINLRVPSTSTFCLLVDFLILSVEKFNCSNEETTSSVLAASSIAIFDNFIPTDSNSLLTENNPAEALVFTWQTPSKYKALLFKISSFFRKELLREIIFPVIIRILSQSPSEKRKTIEKAP